MRDPVPHRLESLGDKPIAALSAMPLLSHETGIKQDAEVLGDGWATHVEMSRNRVDGSVGLEEEIEHPATCGMANCSEHVGFAIEVPGTQGLIAGCHDAVLLLLALHRWWFSEW
jgi:hypothetical protein